MKKALAVFAVGALCSSQIIAQKSFEGAFGQIGTGYESINPTFDSASVQAGESYYPATTSLQSANNFVDQAPTGHYLSVTTKFFIGADADYRFSIVGNTLI